MKDHVLKIIEQVSEKCFRDINAIDDMRFSFNGWGGTRLSNTCRRSILWNTKPFMSFVHLDKAFYIPWKLIYLVGFKGTWWPKMTFQIGEGFAWHYKKQGISTVDLGTTYGWLFCTWLCSLRICFDLNFVNGCAL